MHPLLPLLNQKMIKRLVQEGESFRTTQKSKKSDFFKKSDFSVVWIFPPSCTSLMARTIETSPYCLNQNSQNFRINRIVQESGSFHTTQKSKKSDFLKKSDFSMVWILLLSCTSTTSFRNKRIFSNLARILEMRFFINSKN